MKEMTHSKPELELMKFSKHMHLPNKRLYSAALPKSYLIHYSWGRNHYCLHFTDEETEAEGG